MASKLILTREWRSRNCVMKPGTYDIPRKVSLAHAKCAVADGAGQIVESPDKPVVHRVSRKAPAPENKLASVPEVKAPARPLAATPNTSALD